MYGKVKKKVNGICGDLNNVLWKSFINLIFLLLRLPYQLQNRLSWGWLMLEIMHFWYPKSTSSIGSWNQEFDNPSLFSCKLNMECDHCKRPLNPLKLTKESEGLVRAVDTSLSLFSSKNYISRFAHELNVLRKRGIRLLSKFLT